MKAQNRQHHIRAQVSKASRIHPTRKARGAMQAWAREYPSPPFAKQHQSKLGSEHRLNPMPFYEAPFYRGSGNLVDKVALITGGGSGIGCAVAILFAREGADVAIVDLSEHADAGITRQKVLLIAENVFRQKFCDRAVAQTVRKLGRVDVLVNNAAFQIHILRLEDLTAEHFDETPKTSLYGYSYMAQAVETDEGGGSDRKQRICNRNYRKLLTARLFHDQGWNPLFHSITRDAPGPTRYSSQCGRSRSSMHALESLRQKATRRERIRI
jgi:hypothetical protein